jgi:hypothetical protein
VDRGGKRYHTRFQALGKDYRLKVYPDADQVFAATNGRTTVNQQRKPLGANSPETLASQRVVETGMVIGEEIDRTGLSA